MWEKPGDQILHGTFRHLSQHLMEPLSNIQFHLISVCHQVDVVAALLHSCGQLGPQLGLLLFVGQSSNYFVYYFLFSFHCVVKKVEMYWYIHVIVIKLYANSYRLTKWFLKMWFLSCSHRHVASCNSGSQVSALWLPIDLVVIVAVTGCSLPSALAVACPGSYLLPRLPDCMLWGWFCICWGLHLTSFERLVITVIVRHSASSRLCVLVQWQFCCIVGMYYICMVCHPLPLPQKVIL